MLYIYIHDNIYINKNKNRVELRIQRMDRKLQQQWKIDSSTSSVDRLSPGGGGGACVWAIGAGHGG